jgi:hypothetical protein
MEMAQIAVDAVMAVADLDRKVRREVNGCGVCGA